MKCVRCGTVIREPSAMVDLDEQGRERTFRSDLVCPNCGMKASSIESSKYLKLKEEAKAEVTKIKKTLDKY
jgi:Zn finger protein HypA/HybF involved in hydrogenase expression